MCSAGDRGRADTFLFKLQNEMEEWVRGIHQWEGEDKGLGLGLEDAGESSRARSMACAPGGGVSGLTALLSSAPTQVHAWLGIFSQACELLERKFPHGDCD